MKFYKFLCQLIKISTLFTESLEKGLDKVVSRGEKNFSVHRKYMNFLRPRKTALDEPLYKLSAGRSMVEMLGVLAIIGVLSVGAIAGYSKAMMKYKLNKSVENISYLMNIAYVYMYDIKPSGGSSTKDRSLIPYFIKMNLIPENMIKQGENAYVYDSFGNQIAIFNNEPWNEMGFSAYTNNANSADTQLCRQILDMAQMYYDFIVYISINTGNGSKFYSGALNSSYPDLQKVNTLQECSDGSLRVSIMFKNSK